MPAATMPIAELDISWQTLARIVHDWAGTPAELDEVKPLDGGCINTTVALRTRDGQRAVLKISPHRVNRDLRREAYQLNVLRQYGLPAPEVYLCNVATLENPDSYLLMQHIDGVSLQVARRQCTPEQYDHLQMHLAELTLTLHEQTSTHYHRVDPAAEERFVSWGQFYHHVYDAIWREVERLEVLPVKQRKVISKIHSRLEQLLAHGDKPRLVHWDIWATNVLAAPDAHGRWWVTGLLDPNCKFAHAEAEIAYMDLFNTLTPAFLRAYQQVHRLSAEYHRLRKPIYQLYPLINHLRLFGMEYLKPLLTMVDKAAPLV